MKDSLHSLIKSLSHTEGSNNNTRHRKGTKRKRKGGEEEEEGEGEDYESQERTFDQMHEGKKVKGLLPIKTDRGIIQRFRAVEGGCAASVEPLWCAVGLRSFRFACVVYSFLFV